MCGRYGRRADKQLTAEWMQTYRTVPHEGLRRFTTGYPSIPIQARSVTQRFGINLEVSLMTSQLCRYRMRKRFLLYN